MKHFGPHVSEADLRAVFEPFGTVTNVQLKRDSSGNSLCFAFVTFASKAALQRALNSGSGSGVELDGRALYVSLYRTKQQRGIHHDGPATCSTNHGGINNSGADHDDDGADHDDDDDDSYSNSYSYSRKEAQRAAGLGDAADSSAASQHGGATRQRPARAASAWKKRTVTPPWHSGDDATMWRTDTWVLDANLDALVQWFPRRTENAQGTIHVADLPSDTPLYRWIVGEVEYGGTRVAKVELVKSDLLLKAFNLRLEKTRLRLLAPAFQKDFGTGDATKRRMLSMFRSALATAGGDNVNVLLGWHGCGEEDTDAIISGGIAKFTEKGDAGYFGAGFYLTRQAPYAAGYATSLLSSTQRRPNKRGHYVLLLCAVSTGLTYPITREHDYKPGANRCVQHGRKVKDHCDTHYVHVSAEEKYQATRDPEAFTFEEIVVDQESQVLPFAKVYIKADIPSLAQYFKAPPTLHLPQQ